MAPIRVGFIGLSTASVRLFSLNLPPPLPSLPNTVTQC